MYDTDLAKVQSSIDEVRAATCALHTSHLAYRIVWLRMEACAGCATRHKIRMRSVYSGSVVGWVARAEGMALTRILHSIKLHASGFGKAER